MLVSFRVLQKFIFLVITFQVIQTYSRYSAVPRKLLIGKRLAQCLHPALPSGVHLKVLESYDLIFTQIGANRLAQDLFIYTSGLFPLLSQASMSVKPVLLDLYETHLLPLRKKLYPGLSGFLLALLPGIEEVSEYTERWRVIFLCFFKLLKPLVRRSFLPLLKTIYLGCILFYVVLISNFRFSLKFAVN